MRLPILFLAAVLVPCAVLGWLGWRSLGEERALAERRQLAICQTAADAAAGNVRTFLAESVRTFAAAADGIAREAGPDAAGRFPAEIASRWPLAWSAAAVDVASLPAATDLTSLRESLVRTAATFGRERSSASLRFGAAPDLPPLQPSPAKSEAPVDATAAPEEPVDPAPARIAARAEPVEEVASAAPTAAAAVSRDFTESAALGATRNTEDAAPAPPPAGDASAAPALLNPANEEVPQSAARPATRLGREDSERSKDPPASVVRDRAEGLSLKALPSPATGSPDPAPAAAAAQKGKEERAGSPEELSLSEGSTQRAFDDRRALRGEDGAVERLTRSAEEEQSVRVRSVRPRHVPPDALAGHPLPSMYQEPYGTLHDAVAAEPSGVFSRPGDNGRLVTVFWHRSTADSRYVFLATPDPAALRARLADVLPSPDPGMLIAVLDHSGNPVAERRGADVPAGYSPASWLNPLTATEIGAALPLWETAVWLADPDGPAAAGRSSGRRLALTVCVALLAAAAGAWLLLQEHRRTALDARRKSDFVSNVSHELRTPLTSIRMFSDLLRTNPPPPAEKSTRYAGIIGDEAARLTRLIDSLLDFSRLETGRLPLRTETGDLREPVEEAAAHCRPHLTEAGLTLHLELPDAPVTARFDRDAVIRILTNLFSNAAKYGRPRDGSGNAPIVTVRVEPGAEAAVVSVSDGGPGIPKNQVRRVFRKFERGTDSLAAGIPGSGLGLTLARDLARAMAGDLTWRPASGDAPHAFILSLPAGSAGGAGS